MPKSAQFIGILIISLLFITGCNQLGISQAQSGAGMSAPFGSPYDYSNIRITRVIDGDTVQLENGERVRLIGIDTPEIHESRKLNKDSQRTKQDKAAIMAMGQKAFAFTKVLVEGQQVSLEFDIERKDRYGRLLAYVYLKDGRMVNAEIIKEGYASLMTYPPNVKYVDIFKKLYQEAREQNRGLWAL